MPSRSLGLEFIQYELKFYTLSISETCKNYKEYEINQNSFMRPQKMNWKKDHIHLMCVELIIVKAYKSETLFNQKLPLKAREGPKAKREK